MMQVKALVSLISLLALLASMTSGAIVSDQATLKSCLQGSSETECILDVANMVWNTGLAKVNGIKTVSSSLEDGSTITFDASQRQWLSVASSEGGQSLTLQNLRITSGDVSPMSGFTINVKEAALALDQVLFEDYRTNSRIISAELANVSLNEVVFRRVITNDGLMRIEDTAFSANNLLFDACDTVNNQGLVFTRADLTDMSLHFTGNISILNIPEQVPYAFLANNVPSSSINVTTDSSNPSHFFIRNSNLDLFRTNFNPNSQNRMSFTIGSADVDSTTSSTDYLLEFAENSSHDVAFHVLGDVATNNYGIFSGANQISPPESIRSSIRVDGDITGTHSTNGLPFRFFWSVDVYARSINYKFVPSTATHVTESFILFGNKRYKSTFTVTNSFDLSSTLMPTLITSSSASSSAISIVNQDLVIRAGSFSMSNFSMLPTSEEYDEELTGAAIRVGDSSSLTIVTTSGDVSFVGNSNSYGAGGAIFASDLAYNVLLESLTGDIVFENNTGYYGGALYTPETSNVNMTLISSGLTRFVGNTAMCGGGAVYMPLSQVSSALPSESAYFESNGAFEFGCVFAFGPTANASNSATGVCPSTYASLTDSGNDRLGINYTNATICTVFEAMCDPFTPSTPLSLPIAEPINVETPVEIIVPQTPFVAPVEIDTPTPTGSSSTLTLPIIAMVALIGVSVMLSI